MVGYALKDQDILLGTKPVGRCVKKPSGEFVAVLKAGRIAVVRETAEEAFREAAAQALGFDSEADLKAHNAALRSRKAVEKKEEKGTENA